MSRFYDALKQATRAQESNPEKAGAAEWEPLGIDGLELPPPRAQEGIGTPGSALVADDPWATSAEELLGNAAVPAPPSAPTITEASPEEPVRQPLIETPTLPQNGGSRGGSRLRIDKHERLIPNAIEPAVVEQYRRLRTKLIQQHAVKPFRSLIVTSPEPQDGKTITTLNLALSFAMLPSFRVLVIDGDLRRASLGRMLGVGDHPGLSNLIDGSSTVEDVTLRCDEYPFYFIPSGTSLLPAAELLQSADLSPIFRKVTDRFALVLVDSPPVNLVTDTQLLAGNCDAALLVARAFATTRRSLERAAQDLSSFRVIGTVLNAGTKSQLYRRYGGRY